MNIGGKDLLHKVRVSTLMHRAYARYARERLVDESGTFISECFPLDEAHSVPKGCAVEKTRVKSCVENVAGPPALRTYNGKWQHECPEAAWELWVTGVYRCPRAIRIPATC